MEKWIIATGFSRGIGFELAKKTKLFGYKIFHIGRTECHLEDEFLSCDLGQPFSKDFLNTLHASLQDKEVFGVVYCAGIFPALTYTKNDLENTMHFWKSQAHAMHVNYLACAQLTAEIIPYLEKYIPTSSIADQDNLYPFLAHLSSLSAVDPLPDLELYGITKLATLKYFENLAKQYASAKIACFSLHPGTVKTEMLTEIIKISEFKQLPVFEILKKADEKHYIISPEQSASLIADFLFEKGSAQMRKQAHGKLYCVDIRKIFE